MQTLINTVKDYILDTPDNDMSDTMIILLLKAELPTFQPREQTILIHSIDAMTMINTTTISRRVFINKLIQEIVNSVDRRDVQEILHKTHIESTI